MDREELEPRKPRRRLDRRMRTSLACVAAAGGVFTLGAAVLAGLGAAFSVGIGAALALGNLWALARIIVELLPGEDEAPPRGLAAWAVLGALKMIALVAVVWLLMREGVVSPIPLVVGFGALPVGIAIGAVVSDRGA